MATVTFIPNKAQSTSAMKGVLQYIAQEKKTENGSFVSGLNCSPQFCFQEFTATRKLHHKTSSMYFYHYVQSFSPSESVTTQSGNSSFICATSRSIMPSEAGFSPPCITMVRNPAEYAVRTHRIASSGSMA